jgi:nucleotidyltransferase/DNA polymerase involved in DNA repair
MAGRTILHVDMDAFFASIEQLDFPELRGKPVLIGGSDKWAASGDYSKSRGVVSTASYEARPFGCRSAMPISMALRLCPQAIVRPVRGARIREVSEHVFEIFNRFTDMVQPVSVDEAFLDVTGSLRLFGDGPTIAKEIRRLIASEIGITASVGVAPNKFLAKLASDLNKPDGLTIITPENLDATLVPLSISRVWGIGPKAAKRLESYNVKTIGDLRNMHDAFFDRFFGSWGTRVRELIHGIDARLVHSDHEAKSIGHERTFGTDVHDLEILQGVLLGEVEDVGVRLRRHGLLAQSVSLKIRYGEGFRTITRARRLEAPTNVTQTLWHLADAILNDWAKKDLGPLRLLGMQAGDLTTTGQFTLFDGAATEKQQRLDRAMDRINEKFGKASVARARKPRR